MPPSSSASRIKRHPIGNPRNRVPPLSPKITSVKMRIAILIVSILTLPVSASEKAVPPNIIIMMADDMGMGDTSAYQDVTGNTEATQVKTPAMDRLARAGIRFTDAHSPSSVCTPTRYALLTGRCCWRTRLKFNVLRPPQGDPLIEPQRPTLATLLKGCGYRTGMSGKWHLGLTYRNTSGEAAASYGKSDFRKGIADGPLNHGFDFFHGTARSQDTSSFQGWLFGDRVLAATASNQVDQSQYVLSQTGSVNYNMAMTFLREHLADDEHKNKPFFLYYACHSNHKSYVPTEAIDGRPVQGQSHPGGLRSDFVYENDVALGLLLDFLQKEEDPRRKGSTLFENTLVIFTSDNGAEIEDKTATGPFRSYKGSVYEGGHRVPFIASWPLGNMGDGDVKDDGQSSDFPISLVDLFATFSELVEVPLPSDGAEDSVSILSALRNMPPDSRPPLVFHNHKDGARKRSTEIAWLAIRVTDPVVDGRKVPGKWKLLVDEGLLIQGKAHARELYELGSDQSESKNRIDEPALKPLVDDLTERLQDIHDRGGIRAHMEQYSR